MYVSKPSYKKPQITASQIYTCCHCKSLFALLPHITGTINVWQVFCYPWETLHLNCFPLQLALLFTLFQS